MFRKPSVNFNQLADDALAYSKRNKRSYKTDVPRFANLKEWFGVHAAEELTPREIEHKLAQSLSLADVVALSAGNTDSKSRFKSCPFGASSPWGQQSHSFSHHRRGKETPKDCGVQVGFTPS
jgi:hypothetical protein